MTVAKLKSRVFRVFLIGFLVLAGIMFTLQASYAWGVRPTAPVVFNLEIKYNVPERGKTTLSWQVKPEAACEIYSLSGAFTTAKELWRLEAVVEKAPLAGHTALAGQARMRQAWKWVDSNPGDIKYYKVVPKGRW